MRKLCTVFVIILMIISSLIFISPSLSNEPELNTIDNSDIFNGEISTEPPDLDEKRARGVRGAMSHWKDTFETGSKISITQKVIMINGDVRLETNDGNYEIDGSLTSTLITPAVKSTWKKFHVNSTVNSYKRKITIDNTLNSNSLVDYQIDMILDTKSLIDSGKMRSDCGDIRFYDLNGNSLAYWLESGINSYTTKIWVNVSSIPSSAKSYIYMDYGDPALLSQSDGKSTFEYFDNFEDTPGFDSNLWTTGGPDEPYVYRRSANEVYNGDYALEAQFTSLYDFAYMQTFFSAPLTNKIVTVYMHDNTTQAPFLTSEDLQVSIYNSGNFIDYNRILTSNTDYAFHYYDGGWKPTNNFATRNTGWHELKTVLTGSAIQLYFDDQLAATRTRSGYNHISIATQENWGATFTHYYDLFYIREYSAVEPKIIVGPESLGGEAGISFQILDGSDDSLLISVVDGQDISDIDVGSIKLRAQFTSNGFGTVSLQDWGVDWNCLPSFLAVTTSALEVNRNEETTILVQASDEEDPLSKLNLKVEYRSPMDVEWQKGYLSLPSLINGKWESTFKPPNDAALGSYSLRLRCSDSNNDESIYETPFNIEVMNNKPTKPEISISPGKPRTNDDLTVSVGQASDVETTTEDLELWYRWYRNNIYMSEFDNQSEVPSSYTVKGQTWQVEIQLFDGEELGQASKAIVVIQNAPPMVLEPLGIINLDEDEVDSTTIDLGKVFYDHDSDKLRYACTGQNNIVVDIDQTTGKVVLTPDSDWFGTEELTFTANDTKASASEIVVVEVKSQNDPPVLLKAGVVDVSPLDYTLGFSVYEGTWINLSLKAEDIDGDPITYSTNRTDFIGTDDIANMELDGNTLRFRPVNDDVGIISVDLSLADIKGGSSHYDIEIEVLNVNNAPVVEIIYPLDNMQFEADQNIEFKCDYSDPDLLISGSNEVLEFTWSSNLYFEDLESGEFLANLTGMKLKPGIHEIKVFVKDSSGLIGEDTITIMVDEEEQSGIKGVYAGLSGTLWIVIIIIIAVIVTLIAVLISVNKKRQQESEKQVLTAEPPVAIDAGPSNGAAVIAKPGVIMAPTITLDQISGPVPPFPGHLPQAAPPPGYEYPPVVSAPPPEHSAAYSQPYDMPQPQLPPPSEDYGATKTAAGTEFDNMFMASDETPEETVDEKTKMNEMVLAQLEKLGELKEKGILTDEEFKQKKNELLK